MHALDIHILHKTVFKPSFTSAVPKTGGFGHAEWSDLQLRLELESGQWTRPGPVNDGCTKKTKQCSFFNGENEVEGILVQI